METGKFVPTRMTLVFLLLASMLVLMGGAAVAPALPLISEAFPDASDVMVSLIITIPSLAIVLLGFVVGYIADKFGKVRTLAVALIIFTIAGLSGFFLDSLELIIVGRFILGIGLGGITVATTALIAEYYTGITRVKIVSYQAAVMGFGVLILETSGGALAGIGWREPFLIYLIGGIILIGVLLFLKEPLHATTTESTTTHSASEFGKGTVALCYLTIFMSMFMGFLLPTKFPYYMSELGYSSLISGLFLGVHGIVEGSMCLLYRRISDKLSRLRILSIAFLLIGTGMCLLFLSGSPIAILLGMAISGAGFGMVVPTVVNWLTIIVTSNNSGKVMGGYSACLNLGSFSSSLIIAPVLIVVASYSNMFLVIGIAALCICLVYFISARVTHDHVPESKEIQANNSS